MQKNSDAAAAADEEDIAEEFLMGYNSDND
jgi:hypothetical protein